MAQWSQAERTIYAKVVYYGPAFGGKTTNLESLHRITDPSHTAELLSIDTSDDRTLFFDLLPFDLGEILGYQVALKVYTVPGQVRYDATRQVVLAGADAVVFVADSSAGRVEQNRWSMQNLRMNMRAKRLDPASVPVIYQFNKQDLPEAAPPEEVRQWLGLSAEEGLPAVATQDQGVLETFVAAATAMMERLLAKADPRTRKDLDPSLLHGQLEKAFAPHLERLRERRVRDKGAEPRVNRIVGRNEDLLQDAIQTSVALSEQLSVEKSRAARLDKESDAFRRLSDSFLAVGANFERDAIVAAALSTAAEILNAQAVSLAHLDSSGKAVVDATWNGLDDPLLGFDEGRPLLHRMISARRACVIDDLVKECGNPESARRLYGLRAAVAVPVGSEARHTLVAYGQCSDGHFTAHDIRFLSTLSGHLGVGLERSRLHDELASHRDQACAELRRMHDLKDRLLTNLSHEIKTPLTAILTSAVFMRDYKNKAAERAEMVDGIIASAETAQGLVEDIFRALSLGPDDAPLTLSPADPRSLAREAVEAAGHDPVEVRIEGELRPLQADVEMVRRALSRLVDNAFKFSPDDPAVEIHVQPAKLKKGSRETDALTFSVLDRGPGVPKGERENSFSPFGQGGDVMTAKPRGAGLGLYEARVIATRHGGLLDYLPRQGGGSEFRLTLPLEPLVQPKARDLTHA